jgi:UDP-galactopyranose mutase
MKAVIVGCGIAGSVAARILLDKGWSVQIFDTRNHIGGNCFDSYLNNVMVHNYGPHIFHTDSEKIWRFVNRFSEFNNFVHKVFANTDKGLIPIPFNNLSKAVVGDLSKDEIIRLVYVDYSEKHWGIPFSEIPKSIINRKVIRRASSDDRYFLDKYQGIPKYGYTKLFESMLEGVTVHLSCNKNDWKRESCDLTIYTGKLDRYFDYFLGQLPYRSLVFKHILSPPRQHCVINECNKVNLYTRSYDHSHWLQQTVKQTIISYEYSEEHTAYNEPFYPVALEDSIDIKRRYLSLVKREKTLFLGRLASYQYLDMNDVIKQVTEELEKKVL